jgi:hypothetical protein
MGIAGPGHFYEGDVLAWNPELQKWEPGQFRTIVALMSEPTG